MHFSDSLTILKIQWLTVIHIVIGVNKKRSQSDSYLLADKNKEIQIHILPDTTNISRTSLMCGFMYKKVA